MQPIAVIGAGIFGAYVVQALVDAGANVLVLVRPESSNKMLPRSAKTTVVDVKDVEGMAAILVENRVEILISSIATGAVGLQTHIVDAAVAAGVKLFVPSEFGRASAGSGIPILAAKSKVADYAKSRNLPILRVYLGVFTTYALFATGYDSNGKINVTGDGATLASFTSPEDTAGFLALLLTTVPVKSLADKTVKLEGGRATLNDLAKVMGTITVKVDIVPGEMSEIRTGLNKSIEEGHCLSGYDPVKRIDDGSSGSSNELWPGHIWKGIEECPKLIGVRAIALDHKEQF